MSGSEGRVFQITSSSGRIELDTQRKGEVSFTVTSTRGSIRARALVVPEGSAKGEWFTLEGPAERNFEGTEQFRVGVAIPAGVPSDSYSFHLKVVSEANPDDDFTDGPRAAFDVAPSEAPAKFPWWIVAVVAGVLVLGGVLAYVLWPKEAGLLEDCAGRECAEGLTCVGRGGGQVCLGELNYAVCTKDEECASGFCDPVTAGTPAGVEAGEAPGGICREARAGLGEVCAENECADGLTCVARDGQRVCLGGLHYVGCGNDQDCASRFCDLAAERTATGAAAGAARGGTCLGGFGFNPCSEGDCGTGFICDPGTGGRPTCRGGDGYPGCETDEDCASRLGLECVKFFGESSTSTNVSMCLRSIGASCREDVLCLSQLCEDGVCVTKPNGEACRLNLQCSSAYCKDGTCSTPASRSPCTPACRFPFRCADGRCQLPRMPTSGCTPPCTFPLRCLHGECRMPRIGE